MPRSPGAARPSLRWRQLGLVAVLGLVLASGVALYRVRASAEQQLDDALVAVHRSTALNLESWRERMLVNQRVWAAHPQVERAAAELVMLSRDELIGHPVQLSLREIMSGPLQSNGYEGYFLIGPDGTSLASSRDANIGTPNLLLSQPDLLERAWAGETVLSRPMQSDVPLADDAGQVVPARATQFSIGPVRDATGDVVALFTFRVNPLHTLQDLLDQGQLLSTGESYLVGPDGKILSAVRDEAGLHDAGVLADSEAGFGNVPAELPAFDGGLSSTATPAGRLVPMAYPNYRGTPVRGVWSAEPAMGLGLVTEVSSAESGELARSASVTVLGMGGACLLLLLGLAASVRRRQRAEQAAYQARTEQESAETLAAAKGAFLAQMSHEIRTPLNGVLGMLEVLSDTALDPDQRDAVELASRSGHSLLRVLNDILDFSRLDSGKLQLDPIPADLRVVCGDTVRVLTVNAGRRATDLVVEVAPDLPAQVVVDPERLAQVLANLVGNAVKFTERGTVTLAVSRVAPVDGGLVIEFSVSDTGIGIAPDRIDAVFEEFLQGSGGTSRDYGGTGLGLAISRRLVREMGGELRVESELGVGSRFWFQLPLDEVTAPVVNPALVRASSLVGARVLIVDDTPAAQAVMRAALASAGSEVTVAGSGEEGCALLVAAAAAGRAFHLVLVDGQMPEMDGFEMCRAVRALPVGGDVPLFMLSSSLDIGGTSRARREGLDGFAMKPVPRAALLQLCRAVLALDRSRGDPMVTRRAAIGEETSGVILVVDDNAVNRAVATLMLRREGLHVVEASSGEAALQILERRGVDLVLMDLEMPGLDGREATRLIRASPKTAGLPVLGLTAHVLDAERESCLDAGMNDVFTKPIQADDLLEAVLLWMQPGVACGHQEPPDASSECVDAS